MTTRQAVMPQPFTIEILVICITLGHLQSSASLLYHRERERGGKDKEEKEKEEAQVEDFA